MLKGVFLETKRGDVCAVVGTSGCGKVTLFLSARTVRQTRRRFDLGRRWPHIQFNASDLKRTAACSEHIGFVFQFHFPMLEFTTLGNVMMHMHKLDWCTEKQVAERVRSLLKNFGLGEKRTVSVRSFLALNSNGNVWRSSGCSPSNGNYFGRRADADGQSRPQKTAPVFGLLTQLAILQIAVVRLA